MIPVLTAAQMREVDRQTVALGIPSLILMENAGQRVVEAIVNRYSPLRNHRLAVFCGKGNNGGDGLVIARQLFTRVRPQELAVVLVYPREELSPDAAANLRMLEAAGCPTTTEAPLRATLVVDAILGTGLAGPATGPALDAIRQINERYADAHVVGVDIPSGLPSDCSRPDGDYVRCDLTITFTAPKPAHVFGPSCYLMGKQSVTPIGTPCSLLPSLLAVIAPAALHSLFLPRPKDSNKGMYGHVLVVGGSSGHAGAAAMCGMAALRAGAGLVTNANSVQALPHVPELMTLPLPESTEQLAGMARGKSVIAIGPGLAMNEQCTALVRESFQAIDLPMICDAGALNSLAGTSWSGAGRIRILTPHPGEMARLMETTVPVVQADRLSAARTLATERQAIIVLKGDRTLLAFPDGRVWVNPTGSPAMATGGTGDILTGLIAGLIAQHPADTDRALAAAVYLHGLAGEIGAAERGELGLTATDLLHFLPHAIRHVQNSE